MSDTKLLFSYNIIINELSSVPLLHGVLFLHWNVGRTEGSVGFLCETMPLFSRS